MPFPHCSASSNSVLQCVAVCCSVLQRIKQLVLWTLPYRIERLRTNLYRQKFSSSCIGIRNSLGKNLNRSEYTLASRMSLRHERVSRSNAWFRTTEVSHVTHTRVMSESRTKSSHELGNRSNVFLMVKWVASHTYMRYVWVTNVIQSRIRWSLQHVFDKTESLVTQNPAWVVSESRTSLRHEWVSCSNALFRAIESNHVTHEWVMSWSCNTLQHTVTHGSIWLGISL